MTIHTDMEAAFRDDMRWFADHPTRKFRIRTATSRDALQHECDKTERWVIVERPRDGLYVRLHGADRDGSPDDADTSAAAWLQSHRHKRDAYAIVDPAHKRLFGVGPDAGAPAPA